MRLIILSSFLFILFVFIGCDQEDEDALTQYPFPDTLVCEPPEYPSFSLTDLNPLSVTYNDTIGPHFFTNKVTLYYFPYSET